LRNNYPNIYRSDALRMHIFYFFWFILPTVFCFWPTQNGFYNGGRDTTSIGPTSFSNPLPFLERRPQATPIPSVLISSSGTTFAQTTKNYFLGENSFLSVPNMGSSSLSSFSIYQTPEAYLPDPILAGNKVWFDRIGLYENSDLLYSSALHSFAISDTADFLVTVQECTGGHLLVSNRLSDPNVTICKTFCSPGLQNDLTGVRLDDQIAYFLSQGTDTDNLTLGSFSFTNCGLAQGQPLNITFSNNLFVLANSTPPCLLLSSSAGVVAYDPTSFSPLFNIAPCYNFVVAREVLICINFAHVIAHDLNQNGLILYNFSLSGNTVISAVADGTQTLFAFAYHDEQQLYGLVISKNGTLRSNTSLPTATEGQLVLGDGEYIITPILCVSTPASHHFNPPPSPPFTQVFFTLVTLKAYSNLAEYFEKYVI
jgi:hypothetical protein